MTVTHDFLLQEQLRHKSKFNFVKFDTKAVAWKDKAVDVTEQNLLNAWNWVKGHLIVRLYSDHHLWTVAYGFLNVIESCSKFG